MKFKKVFAVLLLSSAFLFLASCNWFFDRYGDDKEKEKPDAPYDPDDNDDYYDNGEEDDSGNYTGETRKTACTNLKPDYSNWSSENEYGYFEQTWDGYSWKPFNYVCVWECENCRFFDKISGNCEPTAFGGGSGDENDPYKISDPVHLDSIRYCNYVYFVQTKDIDLENYLSKNGAGYNNGEGWMPIRYGKENDGGNVLETYYDGKGFSINNLKINRPFSDYQGLFGKFYGEIKNTNLINVSIVGNDYAGGIAGFSFGNIDYCSVKGNVSGITNVGGIAGAVSFSEINRSHWSGNVDGYENAGGITGSSSATIFQSYSFGSVKGAKNTGGLVGTTYNYSYSYIGECYSTALVNGKINAGGLVGMNKEASVYSSFWDIDNSGIMLSAGGEGKTTKEMKTAATFLDNGWNFESNWDMNDTENEGYPFIRALTLFGGGSGTKKDPYKISKAVHLYNIRFYPSAQFIQTGDIDLIEFSYDDFNDYVGWDSIGSQDIKFTGAYNGQNFTINNLTVDLPYSDNLGLFGYAEEATLENINITNATVSGRNNIGCLSGLNVGSIVRNSSCNGIIIGNENVGGLVGNNKKGSQITQSFSLGSVTGTNHVGGLTGNHYEKSIINNSFSRSDVTRKSGVIFKSIGGFAGYVFDSTIEYSYSTGKIVFEESSTPEDRGFIGGEVGENTYLANFFDGELSGQISSKGAYAETTVNMKDSATFISAEWDFNIIWTIDETVNEGYPFFR